MTTPLVMDALDMAVFSRRLQIIGGVIAHSDAGSQYVSIAYTERLAEIGARPSIGSIGDSYDNSLAESVNGLYKTELIRRQAPWRNVEHVELATLGWVEWFNNRRLHSELGDIPPAEFEANYYARTRAEATLQTPPGPDANDRPVHCSQRRRRLGRFLLCTPSALGALGLWAAVWRAGVVVALVVGCW